MTKPTLAKYVSGSRGQTPGNFVREAPWEYKVVNIADNDTTVCDGPCEVGGVYVNTVLSAHAVPFKDGSTTVFSLIASLAAGSQVDALRGTAFNTSCIVDPNDSATGEIVVQFRRR